MNFSSVNFIYRRYASVNASNRIEQSRRDDLESLGYLLVYFIKGKLPWQGMKGKDRQEMYDRLVESKKNTSTDELCQVHLCEIHAVF